MLFAVTIVGFLIAFLIFRMVIPYGTVASGDISWFINPAYNNLKFLWSNLNLGYPIPQNDLIPAQALYYISILLNQSSSFIFFVLYCAAFVSIFFFLKNAFGLKSVKEIVVTLILSVVYLLNLYTLNSPFQDRLLPIYILLPLFVMLLLKYAATREVKYVLVFTLVFAFFAGSAISPPLFTPLLLCAVILPMFFPGFYKKKWHFLVLVVGTALLAAWWLPGFYYSLVRVSGVGSGINTFRATNAGYLFDNFRLLGSWAWYTGAYSHDYFPVAKTYYTFPLLFLSYLPVLLIVISMKRLRKFTNGNHDLHKLFIYFFILFLVGLTASSGEKYIYGLGYTLLFKIPVLWIFREPFTKFGLLIVFSSVVLLSGAAILGIRVLKVRFHALLLFIFLLTIPEIYPYMTNNYYWKLWNGPMRTSLARIPDYWDDAKNFISNSGIQDPVLAVPYSTYTTAYNWKDGFNSADPVPVYLLAAPILKTSQFTYYPGDYVINDFARYLPYYGSLKSLPFKYVLQQNDIDWRYNSKYTYPPATQEGVFLQLDLKKISSFGKFNRELLSSIPNDEENVNLKNELYAQLANRNSLDLYEVPDGHYLPTFYIPEVSYTARAEQSQYLKLASLIDGPTRSAFYISLDNSNPRDPVESGAVLLAQKTENKNLYNVDNVFWDKGWSWPRVTKFPGSIAYKLMRIKEWLELTFARSPEGKIDTIIWDGAKRAQELYMYNLRDTSADAHISSFNNIEAEGINLLKVRYADVKTTEEKEDYWAYVRKFKAYFSRALYVFEKSPEISGEDLEYTFTLYKEFTAWALSISENNNCNVYAEFADAGSYTQYLSYDGYSWEKEGTLNFSAGGEYTSTCASLISELGQPPLLSIPEISFDQFFGLKIIPKWLPGRDYILSFDFKSNGSDLNIGVYEDMPDYSLLTLDKSFDSVSLKDTDMRKTSIFVDALQSTQYCTDSEDCYIHYQKVFTSSNNSRNGYLFLSLPVEQMNGNTGLIKNLVVSTKLDTSVGFVKEAVPEDIKTKVTFTEINPTKYNVHVDNATKPFNLIFMQNFDPAWKIFIKGERRCTGLVNKSMCAFGSGLAKLLGAANIKNYIQIVYSSYFNEMVVENVTNSIFLEPDTFETWGVASQFDDTHRIVNGFANSWNIDPAVAGSQSFDLIIEYWPQRLFYVGAMVSGFTFIIILGTVVCLNLKKNEKENY